MHAVNMSTCGTFYPLASNALLYNTVQYFVFFCFNHNYQCATNTAHAFKQGFCGSKKDFNRPNSSFNSLRTLQCSKSKQKFILLNSSYGT